MNDLISRGANINYQDENGQTPLHHAVIEKDNDMVKWLVDKKANPKLKDVYGKAPIDYVEKNAAIRDFLRLKMK